MTKSDRYRAALSELDDWEPFLMQASGLPGPRGNLELMAVAADLGDEARFRQFLDFTPERAPTNTPGEFVAACGVVGLGRLAAEGRPELLAELRHWASDPRWRLREAVAMALQRVGRADMPGLLQEMRAWAVGTPLEMRAAAAGLCEPDLLRDEADARQVLVILDTITDRLSQLAERKGDAFQALRKGLGYCWSVAVVAAPEDGKRLMEKWLRSGNKDVRWIMKENLKKQRLSRMDADWVQAMQDRLNA